MSVHALRNPYASSLTPRPAADPRGGSSAGIGAGRAPQAQPQPAALTPLARPAAAAAPDRALPAEAPSGVDAELWSVLTTDERAFFAKAGSMGPLTYGRPGAAGQAVAAAAPTPVALRGGRLDVRA